MENLSNISQKISPKFEKKSSVDVLFLGLRSESNQALLYHIQCIPRHFYRNTIQRSVALEPKPCITEQNMVQLKGLNLFSTGGNSSLKICASPDLSTAGSSGKIHNSKERERELS